MTVVKSESEKRSSGFKSWLPVLALAFSVFIFNTSEFIPIGLLSDISKDLGVSEAKTGLLISAYAWVVAALSLPLMLLFAKTERKRLLIILFSVFILSNILSFLASDYNTLLISRFGVACAHSVFWAIVPPLAVRLAPEGQRSKALSFVAVGSSIAMVLGLPLGRLIGLAFGWRASFISIALIAFLVLVTLIVILPRVPRSNSETIKSLPSLMRRPSLIGLYILTAVIVLAHFTAYSYIEPFIIDSAGFSENFATLLLLVFGIAGFAGSAIFSRFGDRYPYRLMIISITLVALCMLMLNIAASSMATIVILCVVWSISNLLFNLAFQVELIKLAPDATSIAMSIYSGTYNLGIGSGALVGGLVCTHMGISYVGFAGGLIGIMAISLCLIMIKVFFAKK